MASRPPQNPRLSRAAVRRAHEAIAPHVHRTGVVTCLTIDKIARKTRGEGRGTPPRTPDPNPNPNPNSNSGTASSSTGSAGGARPAPPSLRSGGGSSPRVHGQGPESPSGDATAQGGAAPAPARDGLLATPRDEGVGGKEGRRGEAPARPNVRLFFKCENMQKGGAFKARGAFHALSRLTDGQVEGGVVTHSSGNFAQALALAATTRGIPAHIIMPSVSTPSKIAAVQGYPAELVQVYFCGSTEPEREAVTQEVKSKTNARFIHPADDPDIMLGQGTLALEFEAQVKELLALEREEDRAKEGFGWRSRERARQRGEKVEPPSEGLDAVIAPLGGGGLLGGVATALEGTGIHVFGAEPSFQGADDGRRGLAASPPERVQKVSSMTIADGLRTPVGVHPWGVISDRSKVRGVYSVSEEQIKTAMKLIMERMKMVVEPSAAVGLAVVLFDEGFRRLVEREAGVEGWNVGVVLSGGNTTLDAITKLFGERSSEELVEREAAVVGMNGEKEAENVPP